MTQAKIGVVLANVGTPSAPTPKAVKKFLKQFLSDKRVVDLNPLLWKPLLNCVVLPQRSRKVANKYDQIWQQDSPLREISQQQALALQTKLGDGFCVEIGMTYGEPSILQALENLQNQGCKKIVFVPLYPQYSTTTTAAAFDQLERTLTKTPDLNIRSVTAYFDHPIYIQALAQTIEEHWQTNGKAQKLLISFHGIPQRYANNGDPYPQHCEVTAKLLAQRLNLAVDQWQICYQSRFGKEPWLMPYTDEVLQNLAAQGVEDVQIICPAFAADCLETLEEIAVECATQFKAAGGKKFSYIPALNATAQHIYLLADLIDELLSDWV